MQERCQAASWVACIVSTAPCNRITRVRQVRYYLEDDTVDVMEPKQLNSGLPQVPLLTAFPMRPECAWLPMSTQASVPSQPAS